MTGRRVSTSTISPPLQRIWAEPPAAHRNSPLPARRARQWQGARFDDLAFGPVRHVFSHHDDPSGAAHEIHCPTHAFDHLAWDRPVGKVAVPAVLHGAQYGDVDVAAVDNAERLGRAEA